MWLGSVVLIKYQWYNYHNVVMFLFSIVYRYNKCYSNVCIMKKQSICFKYSGQAIMNFLNKTKNKSVVAIHFPSHVNTKRLYTLC